MTFDCAPYEMSDFDVEDAAPCSVCGAVEVTDDWTFHWATPFSATCVAETCSPACTEKIVALRDADGRLTAAAVARAAK